jgi:hypothetical protein
VERGGSTISMYILAVAVISLDEKLIRAKVLGGNVDVESGTRAELD